MSVELVTDLVFCEQLAREAIAATELVVPADMFVLAHLLSFSVHTSDLPGRALFGTRIVISRHAARREQHALIAAEIACDLLREAGQRMTPDNVALISRALLLPEQSFREDVLALRTVTALSLRHKNAPEWMIERRIADIDPRSSQLRLVR
jgi:hypothetical protein